MTQPSSIEAHITDIADIAKARHTAKAYQEVVLSDDHVSQLLDLLRFSASSVNIQPWHFIVAATPEGLDRIAKAGTDETYPFNSDAIRKAGMTVVFASRVEADDDYLSHLLDVEAEQGRFLDTEKKEEWRGIRKMFVDLSRDDTGSAEDWMARQTYWNGGQFLLGAAALGLDATPMEGIDGPSLDEAFGLKKKGYKSLFVITVGRNVDEDDWNFNLPKSRLPLDEITTRL